MTRKNYEAIAEILIAVSEKLEDERNIYTGGNVFDEITDKLSEYFENDNPRFDALRFKDKVYQVGA